MVIDLWKMKKIRIVLKDKIRASFWGELAVSYLHCVESFLLPKLISDEAAISKYYKKITGKEINWEKPETFIEKTNWYKLKVRSPLMTVCADKYQVREYVERCGYGDTLNDLYGLYKSSKEINIEALPDQFVMKTTHGSHMNYIVKDKESFDWHRNRILLNSWMKQDIYWCGREWCYKDIPHRVIVEQYLEDESGELKDYKFFCFNGNPEYIEVHIGRHSNHITNYYDMDGKFIPVNGGVKNDSSIPLGLRKEVFDEMKTMSQKLSAPFQFARIDLYLVNDKVYFGEITFYDGGGSTIYDPSEYNVIFGSKWKIN